MIEAMAMGKPVVASRLGARAEIIEDGKTGLLFESGNSADLLEKTQRLIDEPGLAVRMGRAAREEYLNKYTPDRNYEMLLGIYEVVINKASTRRN